MTGGKRRTEITVETRRRLVVTSRRFVAEAWCRECSERVVMVTVDEAASSAGVSSRTIYRRADTGSLHFAEIADGRLLICFNSLEESIKNR